MTFGKMLSIARQWQWLMLVTATTFLLTGCGKPKEIQTAYGQRGGQGSKSVNGTVVLADMFQRAGHRTSSWYRLSPKLESYDVIIWAPDDFEPPTAQQRKELEEWLGDIEAYGRTLVYIGRDYDAAIAYWETVQPTAPPDQTTEIARRLAHAKNEHNNRRPDFIEEDELNTPDKDTAKEDIEEKDEVVVKEEYGEEIFEEEPTADWFTLHDGVPRQVRTLSGPWSEGVDASKVDIRLESRVELPEDSVPYVTENLLESEGDVLVGKIQHDDWNDGQIIVVANGSFLLNLPLVNHQHRKLAGKLIESCQDNAFYEDPLQVVFLESGPGGPPVFEDDGGDGQTGMEALTIWPINAIVLHAIVAGIILCFAVLPIFGRPKDPQSETLSDFGKHIDSLGELLARTHDVAYAQSRLSTYQNKVKRDSGVSHKEPREEKEESSKVH